MGQHTLTPSPSVICTRVICRITAMMNATRNSAAVRGPTPVVLKGFGSLADVMAWAAVKGDATWAGSQAGSLLQLLAGDEFASMEPEEFASISPDDFEEALASWKYSDYERDYGHGMPDLTMKPPALAKARARVAHRAARLWKHLE